ncbi:hypothetical protein VM1G_12046 [Cytospora mali]|nr:hypothetical protein VM1G_12046 [Valsa mali]
MSPRASLNASPDYAAAPDPVRITTMSPRASLNAGPDYAAAPSPARITTMSPKGYPNTEKEVKQP